MPVGRFFTPRSSQSESELHFVLILIREYKLDINMAAIWGEKTTFQPDASDSKKQIQTDVLIPLWRGRDWMFDVRKLWGNQRVQNSRLTLSHRALWKLSQDSSPAVISPSSLPCHPFFQRWREFLAEASGGQEQPGERGRYSQNLHLLKTAVCWITLDNNRI